MHIRSAHAVLQERCGRVLARKHLISQLQQLLVEVCEAARLQVGMLVIAVGLHGQCWHSGSHVSVWLDARADATGASDAQARGIDGNVHGAAWQPVEF